MSADVKWPQPLRQAAYLGVIGDIVKTIAPETEADPAAILMHVLVMFGNAIGRTAHFQVGADRHHLNLFAGIVGTTAKSRKGVSRGQGQRMFEGVDPDWVRGCITSGLSSGEGLIWAIRDPIAKQHPIKKHGRVTGYETVIEDAGVTDKRLLVIESEFASTLKVMGREGNTLSPVIRQAWDGYDLRTLTKTSTARATGPHISIVGHITRDELRRYLDATECANGFGNRYLWMCARRSRELPDGGQSVDLESCVKRMSEVVQQARQVAELQRDQEAGRLWHQVYGRLSAGRPGLLGAMTARAEAQTMRLACLYALGDMSYVVTLPHLKAALEVWRYAYESATYLFGDRLGDPIADGILSALRRVWPESMTRSEISRGLFARNTPAMEIDRALTLLRDCRLAKTERDRTGDGRPTERWFSVSDESNDIDDITPDPAGFVVPSAGNADDKTPAKPGYVVNVVSVVADEGAGPGHEPAAVTGSASRWAGRLPGPNEPPDGISREAWERHHQGERRPLRPVPGTR